MIRQESPQSRDCSRRRFLQAALCAGVAGMTPARLLSAAERRRRPNFVIIMADDMGYADAGCFGSKKIDTPNIDSLAKRGMRFTDFHSNGAVCSPTRAALTTGRYQQRSGVEGVVTAKNHRHTGMPLGEITFAEVLRPAGYVTGMFGKWHLGYPARYNPVHQGFDEYVGFVSGNVDYHSHIDQELHLDWWKRDKIDDETGYSTDLISDYGVKFIEQHKDKPFCLYIAHGAPHYPYQGRNDPAMRHAGDKKRNEKVSDFERRYKEMIEAMDEGVGKIVRTLRDTGLEKDTLVFFLSDNGPTRNAAEKMGSAGPLRGTKGTLWEGGHRVPGVACWPGRIPAGAVSAETGIGMDLLVTMASLGGAALPEGRTFDGVDLSPVLLENRKLPERTLFWRAKQSRVARKGPWKLLVLSKKKKPMLFNLADDVGETTDLSTQHPNIAEALRKELDEWEANVSKGVNRVSG